MRVCHCTIPAMGGSCVGCGNYNVNVKPMWQHDFSAHITYHPQVGGKPKDQDAELNRKIEELLELLRNRK